MGWHRLECFGSLYIDYTHPPYVFALKVYNGELYVGGSFAKAGGNTAYSLARWNGSAWIWIYGVTISDFARGSVSALEVYNGDLIVGGSFLKAGGNSANNIARFNGTSWSQMGSGVTEGSYYTAVYALAVYNNELIVGGHFSKAGGISANEIARWNGSSWLPFGNGMNGTVYALTVYNDLLIAAGIFTTADGVSANRIACWNGVSWQPFNGGTNGTVNALHIYDGDLIVGGNFTVVDNNVSPYWAKWGLLNPAVEDLNHDCKVDFEDIVLLASQWLQSPGVPSADIAPVSADGIVNFLDFAVLAEHWFDGVSQ